MFGNKSSIKGKRCKKLMPDNVKPYKSKPEFKKAQHIVEFALIAPFIIFLSGLFLKLQ